MKRQIRFFSPAWKALYRIAALSMDLQKHVEEKTGKIMKIIIGMNGNNLLSIKLKSWITCEISIIKNNNKFKNFNTMEADQGEYKIKFISMKNIILKREKEEISFLLDGKNIIVARPDWISIGEEREEKRRRREEKWRDIVDRENNNNKKY